MDLGTGITDQKDISSWACPVNEVTVCREIIQQAEGEGSASLLESPQTAGCGKVSAGRSRGDHKYEGKMTGYVSYPKQYSVVTHL